MRPTLTPRRSLAACLALPVIVAAAVLPFRDGGTAPPTAAGAPADGRRPAAAAPSTSTPATPSTSPSAAPSLTAAPLSVRGLRLPARVQGAEVRPALGGAFVPRFWSGVNLGSTVPGTHPGQVAATRADYDRWLRGMHDLGADVVRVYTILRPEFYAAVRAFNLAHPTSPVYVLHGVWIPEDAFAATRDLWAPAVRDAFRAEISAAVSVVHGDADLPVRRGHASGRYRADIAPWLLGWSLGVEWDPELTRASDRRNRTRPPHRGRFVSSTPGSTSTETWLASMLDHVAALEAARGWSRPLTFTNWLTADPLEHPDEWDDAEDLVSVDAMHVRASRAWPGGFFASYHAYPYYPDFLGLQPDYARYRRPRDGRLDPFSGYLHALRRHHRGQAVMITEVGLPTGIGLAHRGPLGRDQGGHSELDAGRKLSDLLRDVHEEGFAGGVVFEYVDEWFKLTWNTVDHELPAERRALWANVLTNEEHFGLVAADPGAERVAVLDGDDGEWARNGSQVIAETRGPVQEVRAVKDEAYLYLRLALARPDAWRSERLQVAFDVRPGSNGGVPGRPGVEADADVVVEIGPGDRASLEQAAWTDTFALMWGAPRRGAAPFVPVDASALRVGSGVWNRPRLMLNRAHRIPTTGRQVPVETADVGTLRWGTSDPTAPGFDDRNLVHGRGRVLELRVPWALLGYADPSSNQLVVQAADGSVSTRTAGRVGIAVVGGDGHVTSTAGYAWDPWQRVRWHERRKAGWDVVSATFADLATPASPHGR